LSSCYTGRRKPDPEAYRYALEITQRDLDEALFLDDRRENVESAARLGLRTLWVRDPDQIREELASAGIVAG
ncbi:Haloacid dehalogenase-like hydrolase domain protein, partial [mine drainage metagenome]